ncbi:MAG: substrate-binding periplasmic protein [Candidatus Limnocylindria bacterium]
MRGISGAAFAAFILVIAACGARPAASPTPTATADPLASLLVRGTLVVSIRMVAPPAQREQGDAAHEQKRALEAAIATALAQRILGPTGRADFRNTGRDRTGPVANRDADIAMANATASVAGITFSRPYAAGGVVLVTTAGSSARVEDLVDKTIATTPGDTNSAQIAQAYFAQRSIQVKLQMFTGLRAAVEALDAGQVTAVVGDRTGIAVVNRGRTSTLRTVAELASQPFAVAVRADATALLARVNDGLSALAGSGDLKKFADAADFPFEAP